MSTNSTLIREQLVEYGRKLFDAPKQFNRFTKDDAADALLNDLDHYPHVESGF